MIKKGDFVKCPVCNGNLKKSKEPYNYAGKSFGKFDADKCSSCGEVFFTEESSDSIDAKAKKLGLWGLGQKSKIGYSGNSLIVRIPKKIAEFLEIEEGEEVFVHPGGRDKLVVETRSS